MLGLGVTGFAVADTLTELGADVLVIAPQVDDDRATILDVIGARLLRHPLDDVPAELVAFAPEVLVVSPGFHPDHPVLEWAGGAGVAVWGDIELAWRVRDKVNAGRMDPRHGHQRQDHDRADDRDVPGRQRPARSTVRQHRRAGPRCGA